MRMRTEKKSSRSLPLILRMMARLQECINEDVHTKLHRGGSAALNEEMCDEQSRKRNLENRTAERV